MGLGKQIKKATKEKGMSLRSLAEKAGISYNTLYSITKRDSDRIGVDTIQRIADVLGVSLSELAGLEQIDRFTLAHEAGPEVYRKLEGNYQRHNMECSRISMEESNRLLDALGLVEEGQDLSDDDLAFLAHIIGQLDVWFGKRRNQPTTAPESSPPPSEGKDTAPPPDAPETPPEGE